MIKPFVIIPFLLMSGMGGCIKDHQARYCDGEAAYILKEAGCDVKNYSCDERRTKVTISCE